MHTPNMAYARRWALLAACGLLPACVSTTPDWDGNFGVAARGTLARQVMHPDAGGNADPVAGMDGRAASAGYEQYQKAYAEPPKQPATFTIGVSGSK